VFILTTYADQQRWVSAFEPLLYPTGFSFYRPFSYVPHYIVPSQLAGQLADTSQSESLLSQSKWNDGYFGLRFKEAAASDFLSKFVPLRRVSLTAVEAGESISLYFRLGNFVVPELRDGKKHLPTLDVSRVVGDVAATKLFIDLDQAERDIAMKWQTSETFPDGLWDSIEGALSPPAIEKAKGTVLLRLTRVSNRGADTLRAIEEIDKLRHMWGCRLRVGEVYDLHFNYYRIGRSGKDVSFGSQRFCITNARDEVQASRRTIPITGNYRAEDVWVSPLEPTQGPVQISFEPCSADLLGVTDPAEARMIGVKIPVTFASQTWPASRKWNLALFVLFGILACYLYHRYGYASDNVRKVLLLCIATSVSVAVTALKDFLLNQKVIA